MCKGYEGYNIKNLENTFWMVNNTNYIVDEAENKFLPIEYMKPEYVKEFERQIALARNIEQAICMDKEYQATREELEYHRKWSIPFSLSRHYITAVDYSIKPVEYKSIAKLMNVEPFRTAVMINISPNWKGKINIKSPQGKLAIKRFKQSILDYISSCNRYTKYKAVIECGGDGDFLHAHIVAQIEPRIEKSVVTHLNKGNHRQELMKHWDKNFKSSPSYLSGRVKGTEGVLKGKFAIQRILIRKEEILNDKLNYLVEENKPLGHKNAYDLGCLFGDY